MIEHTDFNCSRQAVYFCEFTHTQFYYFSTIMKDAIFLMCITLDSFLEPTSIRVSCSR